MSESGYPLRVLVVDDSLVGRETARLLLTCLGHQPDFAANGREALAAAARETYDLVLMDVQMPVMDGIAATRALRRRCVEGARPRIVGLSGDEGVGDRLAGEAAGMDGYISKPLSPVALRAVLSRCAHPQTTPSTR